KLQRQDVGRTVREEATPDVGHRTHRGSGAFNYGMAPSLRRDVAIGGRVGEYRVCTKGAKRRAPCEPAVVRHPVTKTDERVVAVVEARPQPFPGRDTEL